MVNLFDEVGGHELSKLVSDGLFAVLSESAEPLLDQLPSETQRDIVALFTFAPSELERTPTTFREYLLNCEFDDPRPLML